MKKIIALVLALTMCLTMVACGKPAEDTGKTLDKAGTYTGTYDELTITAADVVLENATAKKITIAESVGDGDVTLNNVTVDALEVYGGGEHSIRIIASAVIRLFSEKLDSLVRIEASEGTTVETMETVNTIVEVITGGSVTTVTARSNTTVKVAADASAGEVVVADTTATAQLAGIVQALTVDAPAAVVEVAETAKVETVAVTAKAEEASLTIKGEVTAVAVEAPKVAVAVAQTATVAEVKVAATAEGAKTDIAGTVAKTEIAAANTAVTVTETAKVEEVKVVEKAENTTLVVEGTVTKVDTEATTTVTGNGTVAEVQTSNKENVTLAENSTAAQGTTVTEKPAETTTPETTTPPATTTPPTATTPPAETTPDSGTSSGSSSGGSSHKHTYEWQSDIDMHWQKATCCNNVTTTPERHDRGEGDKCTVCGVDMQTIVAFVNGEEIGRFTRLLQALLVVGGKEEVTLMLDSNVQLTGDALVLGQHTYEDVGESFTVNDGDIPKNVTLNLNGYTITTSAGYNAFVVKNGYLLRIEDSSEAQTGKIVQSDDKAVVVTEPGGVYVGIGNTQVIDFKVNDGAYQASENGKVLGAMMQAGQYYETADDVCTLRLGSDIQLTGWSVVIGTSDYGGMFGGKTMSIPYKNIVVDLNGHAIVAELGENIFQVQQGYKLTLTDSSNGYGKLIPSGNVPAVLLNGGDYEGPQEYRADGNIIDGATGKPVESSGVDSGATG